MHSINYWLPEQASTVAPEIDYLFYFLVALTGFFTVLIAILVLIFAIRFRRRSETEIPSDAHGGHSSVMLEIGWSVVPFVITMVIFAWSAVIFFNTVDIPEGAEDVYVVGKQWMWKVEHLGGQREINHLTVPVGRPIKLIITSEDVIHSFYIPEFRLKQDAVPGYYTYMWFTATKPGTYQLYCAEYCGTEHARMVGDVTVLDEADYQKWLSEKAEGSMALEGRKLFSKLQCITCHSADYNSRAPVLENLYGRGVHLADGKTLVADENYLRKSILEPQTQIVAGYQNIMPVYEGQVTEEELVRVIAFIKSLKPGTTPPRVGDSPAPEVKPRNPESSKDKS